MKNNIKVHSTQKPEALLYRIIVLFTKKGDLVLDPFGGTMTTAAICKKTGRNYTMIEREDKYIKYGTKRLKNIKEEITYIENATLDIKPLKVSFSEMVDKGYFILGETFYHKNNEEAILVDNNGKLKYHNIIDSMHEIAAKMMNKNRRVNAYDYLYVKRNNNLISISKIRDEYRNNL